MDHHWVGGECNHHYDCGSFPHPGSTSPKCVLVIGECDRENLQKSKYDEGCMSCKKFSYSTMLVFFEKCVLSSAVAKSEGGLSCPERTLATNCF